MGAKLRKRKRKIMWGVVIAVLFGIIGLLGFLLYKQSNKREEDVEPELELDQDNLDQSEKVHSAIANFNFLFNFPEIEEFEKAKEEYETNANDQNKEIAMRFLMKRAGALMQKGSMFNQASPHIVASKKINMCDEVRWNNFLEAKSQLEAEGENIKREADELKSGWGEEIFQMVAKLQKDHMDKMKAMQEAQQKGQPAPQSPQGAPGSPQEGKGNKKSGGPKNSRGAEQRKALQQRLKEQRDKKNALNAPKPPSVKVSKAEEKQKQEAADKAFRQLEAEERNNAKKKKAAKKPPQSPAADELD